MPGEASGPSVLIEQKQLREVRKRAFDEITICRRAAEEALSALAEHFPDLDRSELEERLRGLQARTPVRSTKAMPMRSPGRVDSSENGMRGSLLIKRAMPELESVTLITTTDLLVRLVTKAFRRKLRRFVKPNKPPEHLSPELILEACPTLSDYGQPVQDLADIVVGRALPAGLARGARERLGRGRGGDRRSSGPRLR